MPIPEPSLTATYRGCRVDPQAMRASGWHDQGGSGRHRMVPATPGLWALPIEPFERCDDHPVYLLLVLRLDDAGAITEVETRVCFSRSPSAFTVADLPFHYPDMLTAKAALDAALSDEGRRALAERVSARNERPLVLRELIGLVDRRTSNEAVTALIARFGLVRTPDPIDGGDSYTADHARLELMADPAGRVTTLFIRLRDGDLLDPGIPMPGSRTEARALLGRPTCTGDGPASFDRWDTPRHALHVAYRGGAGRLERVTIMATRVAP